MPKNSQETTKQRLVNAATRVFAEKGYRDATVREICKLAGTANINAVNYYFGSKVQLYKHILESIFAAYDRQAPDDFADTSPEAQLQIYISTFCSILYQQGGFDANTTAIFVEEMTKPSPFLLEMVDRFNRPRVEKHLEMFKRLLGEGATDDMARDCMVSVSGQLLYYSFARPLFTRLFPDYFTDDAHARWAAHVFKFTMGGIVACRPARESKK